MKTTIKKVLEFTKTATIYISVVDKLPKKTPAHIKLKYAAKKVQGALEKKIKQFQETELKIKLDHCFLDADGCIVYTDKGNYKFTKTKEQKVIDLINKELEKTIEFTPHYVDIVEDLPFSVTSFTGFVFKELTEEEELKMLESK